MAVLERGGAGGLAVGTTGRPVPAGLLKVLDAVFLRGECFEYLYDIHDFRPSV